MYDLRSLFIKKTSTIFLKENNFYYYIDFSTMADLDLIKPCENKNLVASLKKIKFGC